ncbi:ATP dependent DNA ligase (fragment) [Mesorhizobium sp. SOD10]
MGIRRDPGKPAVALVARDGKYAGGAVITANRSIKERLWRRVEEARAKQPTGVPAAVTDDVEWVRSGIVARVKTLRGEAKLRHASMLDFREG